MSKEVTVREMEAIAESRNWFSLSSGEMQCHYEEAIERIAKNEEFLSAANEELTRRHEILGEYEGQISHLKAEVERYRQTLESVREKLHSAHLGIAENDIDGWNNARDAVYECHTLINKALNREKND